MRALTLTLLLGGVALAEDRTDHLGALGVTVAGGAEFGSTIGGQVPYLGFRAPLELGATLGVTDRTEVRVAGRLAPPWPQPDWSLTAGIRNSRGALWKTFFDLDLAVHLAPLWTVGLRFGFGVQYELSPVLGVFLVAAVQGGGGAGLRLAGELLLGFQLRSYLFF